MKAGDKYGTNNCGELEIIECINSKKIQVRFTETGCEVVVRAYDIRRGQVKDPLYPLVYAVGFFGVGRHKASIGGKQSASYTAWKNMLERCYCPKSLAKYPTYIGCSVDSRWHDYQVFAEWFDTSYKQGFHLDKDLIVEGNKIYGPEACVFVSAKTNTFTTDCTSARGDYMVGVCWNKSSMAYQANCRSLFTKKAEYLGLFSTEQEAHAAWKARKHQHALILADEQSDPRVAAALRIKYLPKVETPRMSHASTSALELEEVAESD